jgi:hypothetical protein
METTNPKLVRLFAYINFDKQQVKVQPVFGDLEIDMKLWLEVAGFMMARVMNARGKKKQDMLKDARDYLKQCLETYKVNE